MATKPTTTTPSLPRIDFFGKPFSYTLGAETELSESGGSKTTALAAEISTPAPAEIPKIVEEVPALQISTTGGGLATGTVSRQIIGGVLNYVLAAMDGKNYILYNSAKWRDIDNLTKSADKNKSIAVFGEYYINRFGVASGIKFTRFDILN